MEPIKSNTLSFFINEENICRCACSSQGWTLLKPPGMAAYERIVFYESPFCCNLFVIIGVLIKHASTVGSKRRTQCRAVITFPRPPCEPCNPPAKKPLRFRLELPLHPAKNLGVCSCYPLQRTLGKSKAPQKKLRSRLHTMCKELLLNPLEGGGLL